MPRIYPFRAVRYNPAKVSAGDVVTQPGDRISPAMQQAYYDRSPYNLVRVILRQAELFDRYGDAYANAARDFAAWRQDGILAQEREPCVFAYSQRFRLPGKPGVALERRGFIAVGELYDYSQGVILPHEETLPRRRVDRLNLLRATRADFEPILMLYSDPANTAEQLLFGSGLDEATLPEIEVTDEQGVLHRVWKVSDPAKINLLTACLEDRKLIIAEGHHRYEAALEYAQELALKRSPDNAECLSVAPGQPTRPETAAMMAFVNMESDGLVILPTHRVVFGLKDFQSAAMLTALRAYFAVEELAERDAAAAMTRLARSGVLTAFVAVTREGWYLLTAKPAATVEAMNTIPERQRRLDVAQLHRLVLEHALGLAGEAIREESNLRYVREAAEAADQIERGDGDVAFLMNPVSLDQVREVAFAGEVMPQKSTDIYPKLLSGLAIYAMD